MANASSTLPIDKLTDDILRQIFMWAVYGITTDNPMAGGRRFRFGSIAPGRSGMLYVLHPIIIGHVCSHWRNLTFSSPVLWSTMVVEPRRSRDVEIFAFWLERSGGASLSLTFFFPDDYEPPMAEAFRLAFQHRSRWREISLISRFEWFDENMITGTLASEWQQATFDQLESFSVLGAFVSSVHQLSWNPLPPVFRSPTLKALGVPFDCLWQGAPLPQLTSLSLSGSTSASPASVLAILSRCALLKELRVGIDDIVDVIPSDYRELVLANLISLDINGSGTGPCTVLTHITTPQLVILKLSQYSLPEPPTLPFEALFKFAQRSNCRLQSLTLDGAKDATVEPPTLRLLLLPSISSLDELSFEDSPNLASAVVNALTSTPTLLPGLRVINFDRSSHFLHNVEAPELLSALLQSRTMLRAEVGRR